MTGMRLARGISREGPKQHASEAETLLSPLEQRGLIVKAEVLEDQAAPGTGAGDSVREPKNFA